MQQPIRCFTDIDSSPYSFATQSIPVTSILNARELGGYLLPTGRVIKKGLLLRGASIGSLSQEDAQILTRDYHLAVDFDFRTEEECRHTPDIVPPGVKYMWLPAIDPQTETVAGMTLPKEAYADLAHWLVLNADNGLVQDVARRLYTDMVVNEYTQLQYAAFLQTIVNTPQGAVYWHCSQGKDRTGIGAAVLLCALGADRQLILKDYIISNEIYQAEVDLICAQMLSKGISREALPVIQTFVGVNPDYFIAALDLIDKQFGSLEGYVRGPLCMADEDLCVLRERYTEPVLSPQR